MAEPNSALFADAEEFRRWLHDHHSSATELSLRIAKKSSRHSSVTYQEALEVALCYGWIDGRRNRFDDDFFVQRFTPRTSRSPWSVRNVGIVARLEREGLLQPAGIAEMEKARADGRWERAYEGQAKAQVPQDFLAALAANPKAQAFFDTLNSTNRFTVAYRLQEAKRPETRARRIATFVAQLAKGEKFH